MNDNYDYRLARVTAMSRDCLTLCDFVNSSHLAALQAATEYCNRVLSVMTGTHEISKILVRTRLYADLNLIMPVCDSIEECYYEDGFLRSDLKPVFSGESTKLINEERI